MNKVSAHNKKVFAPPHFTYLVTAKLREISGYLKLNAISDLSALVPKISLRETQCYQMKADIFIFLLKF